MKNRTRKTLVRGCSVGLVAFMIAGVALLDLGKSNLYAASVSADGAKNELVDVTGKYDSSALREKYLNKDIVSQNPVQLGGEDWYIVELSGESLMDGFEKNRHVDTFSEYVNTTEAHQRKAKLEREQRVFEQQLAIAGVRYEKKYAYTELTNGMAIRIRNQDVATVKAIAGVEDVYATQNYAVPKVAVSNNANTYTTGIYDSSESGYDGENMVVAVLDTGLDHTHPAFQNLPESGRFSQQTIADAFQTGKLKVQERNPSLTASDVYVSSKIPFAYDYSDNDTNVYPSYSNHGTHVAGIIAGKDDDKIVNAETDERFIGVAPEAQLVICKVFSDNLDNDTLGSANSIDIIAALNDCIVLGVDVINMSLGTSAGFSAEPTATEDGKLLSELYQSIEDLGISLVVAASNDFSSGYGGAFGTNLAANPDSGTVGSPSTYDSPLSVASINGQPANYLVANGNENDVAFITESSDANGNAYKFLDLIYEKANKPKSEPLTLNYVVIDGTGRPSDYRLAGGNDAFRDGKTIALVKRGDTTFADKVKVAKQFGAFACIIYNNLSGNIRMTLGEANEPIPTCSVSMDAGKILVDGATMKRGTVTFSYEYSAGPFMSDFSSWGPTPDLKLKPEITAHGGEITSAVPGGYASLSGTSMAAPNMSGAIALLRQHGAKAGYTGKALSEYVAQLLMSTATMARNEEGNPYSPRKQGAGLAGINDAIKTQGYLTVDGCDKPKAELGDDPKRTGVYEFSFNVNSISSSPTTYVPKVYVMTESISSDGRTIAEKAYMLDGCKITVKAGGAVVANGGAVTVPAGGSVKIDVKIELDDAAREYLESEYKDKKGVSHKYFENGMFVEGYVRLEAEAGNDETVELGLPYLGFYGDWNDAPMFDYDTYEIAASEADNSVDEADKLKASASSTRPLGLYYDKQYIVTLGAYMYSMPDGMNDIVASDERASISGYDNQYKRTVYEFYAIYVGLLRGAKEMKVQITDTDTGEVVYDKVEYNVRKSYAAGGSNIGSLLSFNINPFEFGLANNNQYTVSLKGKLDYEGAEFREDEGFSFSFTVDTEVPVISDYRIRYEPYEENEVTKYRIYLDADVSDNHYAMSVLPCYLRTNAEGKQEYTLLTELPIPVYSTKGGTTTVSLEVTDIFDEYVKTGRMYLVAQDYALNESQYNVIYTSATEYPESIALQTDGKLTQAKDKANEYNLTLAQYENYRLNVVTNPSTASPASLSLIAKSGSVACKDNEIFAVANNGKVTVQVCDGNGKTLATVNVTIAGTPAAKPSIDRIVLGTVAGGNNYIVNANDSDVELNPNTETQFTASVEPWYCAYSENIEYEWTSGDETAFTVDAKGVVRTLKKSSPAPLTVKIKGNNMLSKTVQITVADELDINNGTLMHFYGGKNYVIPDSKNVLQLHEEAFQYNTTIETLVLPVSLTSIPENAFLGCSNLREIVIPAKCTVIHRFAFRGCEKLEKITLLEDEDKITKAKIPGTLTLGRSAFEGCISLKTIENQKRITTASDSAFENCVSLESIDISGLRVGGDRIFAGCTSLKTVTTDITTHVGKQMFFGCTSLESIAYNSATVPEAAFEGCEALSAITFGVPVTSIGARAFAGTAFSTFTLPNGEYAIGENAFEDCGALKTIVLSAGTKLLQSGAAPFNGSAFEAFVANGNPEYTVENGVLYSKDKKTLLAMPAFKTTDGEFTVPDTVVEIGAGAFAGSKYSRIRLNNVKTIGAYAFANSALTEIDLSGFTEIPEGAFSGCTELRGNSKTPSVTGLNAVLNVGAYAFYGCENLKQQFDLPVATEIGAHAFEGSKITGLTGGEIGKIGEYAFFGTNLDTVEKAETLALPKLTELGAYAFAKAFYLTNVQLGPVERMGEYVFAGTPITTISFASGTKELGVGMFAVYNSMGTEIETVDAAGNVRVNENVRRVTVPDTVEKVGARAFYGCVNLTNANNRINLSNVKLIESLAFYWCPKVTTLDLSSVETVEPYAFSYSGLTSASLDSAKTIGDFAFSDTQIATLSMPRVERLYSFAFMNTKLTRVEIPASMNQMTFEDDHWTDVDDFGFEKQKWGKMLYSYGMGVFASIPTLTEITVAEGNAAFVSFDGVLYGKLENGKYVLLQYPAGKQNSNYTVKENTVRIGDASFYMANLLLSVKFPYTVKSIGSRAFLASNVKDYTFESVEAPVLEAAYDEYVINFGNDSNNAYLSGLFYSNFYRYLAEVYYGQSGNLGLTIRRPANGIGYDTAVWKGYFSNVVETDYAETDETKLLKEDFAKLASAEEILAGLAACGTNEEKLAYLRDTSEKQVAPLRLRYNAIDNDGQYVLLEKEYEKLTEIEALLREERGKLGDEVAITKVVMAQNPVKYRYYVGETFESAGMVIKAIYADASEVILGENDYTIGNTEPLTLEDRSIIVTYVHGGTTYTCEVLIQVSEKPPVIEPVDPPIDEEEPQGQLGLIIGLSVAGGVIVLAGVAVAIVLVLRSKRKNGASGAEVSAEPAETAENGANEGAQDDESHEE